MYQLKDRVNHSESKNMTQLHIKYKDICRLKVNEWRKIYLANTSQKKAGVAILISDRADFKVRKIIRDKEGHYIMIKGFNFPRRHNS